METKSLIQKFWLLMQQWREKSSKLYQSQKVQREHSSPAKSLVPIKNSFHLVEIAPRCEKTNNRGMVMEALQSLYRSPIQQIGIEGQIAFRVLSLRFRSSHNLFTFISNNEYPKASCLQFIGRGLVIL